VIPNLSENSADVPAKSSSCFWSKQRKEVQDMAVIDKEAPVQSHNTIKEIKEK
jgi:hypothetical protein